MNNDTEICGYEHTPVMVIRRDGEIDRWTMYAPTIKQLLPGVDSINQLSEPTC